MKALRNTGDALKERLQICAASEDHLPAAFGDCRNVTGKVKDVTEALVTDQQNAPFWHDHSIPLRRFHARDHAASLFELVTPFVFEPTRAEIAARQQDLADAKMRVCIGRIDR